MAGQCAFGQDQEPVRHVLDHFEANPIKPRMPGSGKQCKVSDSTKKAMKKKVMEIPTITTKQLKKALQSTKHCPVMLKMFICVH